MLKKIVKNKEIFSKLYWYVGAILVNFPWTVTPSRDTCKAFQRFSFPGRKDVGPTKPKRTEFLEQCLFHKGSNYRQETITYRWWSLATEYPAFLEATRIRSEVGPKLDLIKFLKHYADTRIRSEVRPPLPLSFWSIRWSGYADTQWS